MANRRQFMKTGLAFSALSINALSPLQAAVASSDTPSLMLEDFVFDSRFSYATELARQVGRQGVSLSEITGDLTDLWYNSYSKLWKQNPMALAGVTASDGLFVLETLAADHGMQVIHKSVLEVPVSQPGDPDETLYTWIIAPKKAPKKAPENAPQKTAQ